MDAYRVGDNFVAHFDLPGVDPGSIDLSVDGHTLTVTAERSVALLENAEWAVAERPFGSYTRQIVLGRSLDIDLLEASYHDGVLTVSIPVAGAKTATEDAVQDGPAAAEGPDVTASAEARPLTTRVEDLGVAAAESAGRSAVRAPDTVASQVDATAADHPSDRDADAVERAQRSAARALVAVKDRLGEPIDAKILERAGMKERERRSPHGGPWSRLVRAVRGS
jgi:HSP20 family protein